MLNLDFHAFIRVMKFGNPKFRLPKSGLVQFTESNKICKLPDERIIEETLESLSKNKETVLKETKTGELDSMLRNILRLIAYKQKCPKSLYNSSFFYVNIAFLIFNDDNAGLKYIVDTLYSNDRVLLIVENSNYIRVYDDIQRTFEIIKAMPKVKILNIAKEN